MVETFYDHPGYIGALAANVRRHWQEHGRGSLLLMSFHGLPKSAAFTYETQCRATSRLLAKELQLNPEEWKVTFQSRFGYAEWLQPYTEQTLVELAQSGQRRVDVVCPGFVCDCLETLEEIGMTARAKFTAAGGSQLLLLPCLNESPEWIAALGQIARAA
jgi:ferrochelatase